jgi:SanA protein
LGRQKKIVWGLLGSFIIALLLTITCDYIIEDKAKGFTYSSFQEIPKNRVGLLLGTAKYQRAGGVNPYFQYRINAAVNLFQKGKVDFILVSGDNSHRSYNEPIAFQKELILRGIPEECIFLDYAGFSTLDSVIRAKEIFGQTRFTIISQKFHNERAIYLAQKHGIEAIGFNAKDLQGTRAIRVKTREYLARTKAVLDILRGAKPKFLGEPISIE